MPDHFDLQPTVEQKILRDSAQSFCKRANGPQRNRGSQRSHWDRSVWTQMAEAGFLGLRVPERFGGSALGVGDLLIVCEEMGRVLLPEPFVDVAVLARTAIERGDNEELKEQLLPLLCNGDLIALLAWQEGVHSLECAQIRTRAERGGKGWVLTGYKLFVNASAIADGLVVLADTDRGQGLFWVECDQPGVSVAELRLADGGVAGNVQLDGAHSQGIVASPGTAASMLARAFDEAILATSAELCGLMQEAFARTIEYLKTRQQFGRLIGSFQALQHRAADLYIQQELARATLADAATRIDAVVEQERALLTSRVKARCSQAALRITEEAIQMHGGIGFTDEHDIGLFLKRALVLSARMGNAAEHRRRYMALSSVQRCAA